jgi:hypothetical protein
MTSVKMLILLVVRQDSLDGASPRRGFYLHRTKQEKADIYMSVTSGFGSHDPNLRPCVF